MERTNIFNSIYKENKWGDDESVSGSGSRLENTENLRNCISLLLKHYNIKSIIDAPCGDMNWIKMINLDAIKYYGFDIVSGIIENNKTILQNNKNFYFETKDVINEKLPQVDLIICRDLIIHFPLIEIYNLLKNFVASGSKYLLITKFDTCEENKDIQFGNFSMRNLEKPPFNFDKPLLEIFDHEIEYLNKIVLYDLNDVKKNIEKIENNKNFFDLEIYNITTRENFLNRIEEREINYIKLFGLFPLLKIIKIKNKKLVKLFNLIPILTTKIK